MTEDERLAMEKEKLIRPNTPKPLIVVDCKEISIPYNTISDFPRFDLPHITST